MSDQGVNPNNPKAIEELEKKVKELIKKNKFSEEIFYDQTGIQQHEIAQKNKTASNLAIGSMTILGLIIAYQGFILYSYYKDMKNIQVPDGNIEMLKYRNEVIKSTVLDIKYAVKDLFMFLGSIITGIFAYYFASGMKK